MASRNPNNWHWTEKNCLPWAKEYFGRELVGVEVKGASEVAVKTLEITACEGDVDLNQRKGKIITLFDLKISLKWTGTKDGITARGTIDIPEVAHDTEVDDYVFDITVEGETREMAPIKDVVRKELTAALRQKLVEFAPALIDAHAKDVQYDQNAANGNSPIPSPKSTPKPTTVTSNIPSADSSKPKPLNTTTLTESVEFVAPAHDVYEVFLDSAKVKAWTRSDAQVSRDLGSAFSLFDGNITGKVLNLEYDKKIVQTWRLKSWPKDHYSTVTMTITPGRESVTLNLKQDGVPVGEVESVRQNWKNYYWQRIKSTFGFGATF